MEQKGQIKSAAVFAVGLVVGLALGYYVAGVKGTLPPPDIIASEPAEGASAQAVAAYKDALLRRAESRVPLSDTERAAMARALLLGASAYGFTSAETALLGRALAQ
jgi:hypothetical protein